MLLGAVPRVCSVAKEIRGKGGKRGVDVQIIRYLDEPGDIHADRPDGALGISKSVSFDGSTHVAQVVLLVRR